MITRTDIQQIIEKDFSIDVARFFSMTDANLNLKDWTTEEYKPINLWRYLNGVIQDIRHYNEDIRIKRKYCTYIPKKLPFVQQDVNRFILNEWRGADVYYKELYYLLDELQHYNNQLGIAIMHTLQS